jgi:hypothetical protein
MERPVTEEAIQYSGKYIVLSKLTTKAREYLKSLKSLFSKEVTHIETGMYFGDQEKYVTVKFTDKQVKKWKSLELIQLTDLQYGHICCKVNRVHEYREWVLSSPNRFLLLTGDLVDASTAFSPGSTYDNIMSPQNQVYRFAEEFAPLRHRILGYVGGNHERRAIPAFGDLGSLIATYLQIPYSAGKQHIDIHFGEHKPFKVTLWHGIGGARTKGAVAQVLDRFMQKGDSQLYLMGHLHQGLVMPGWREEREPGSNKIKLKKIMGAVGTSFVEFVGSYGEVMGLNPHDVMMARAVLQPDEKWELTLR